MFFNCKSITYVDLSEFDASSCQSMSNMFHYCKELKSIMTREMKDVLDKGTLLHYCFEVYNFKKDNLNELHINDEYKNYIRNFLKHDEVKDISKAITYKEHDIRITEDGVTKNGVIDLLVEYEDHFEYDVAVKVIKRRHRYYLYLCQLCGTMVKSAEGPDFRSQCQYGPNVQAIALSLMNTVNAPMNKVALFLAGITGEEISPCNGYIAKLQSRAAKGLKQFYADLRLKLITLSLLYWDDTVIFINTKRACFRFYGNESIAFYTAHMKKGLKGLKEDNVLPLLTGDTKAMHDHNTVNYNPAFHFQNLECDQHLERDCQKNSDDTNHQWSLDLKEHIASTIHDRNVAEQTEKSCFDADYIAAFNSRLDKILQHGWQEYEADKEKLEKYGAPFERALLTRVEKYRSNYFAWLEDFTLPTTNNLSERSLRPVKSKMKIAGQFEAEENAQHYAVIRSYIETCRRKGVNENEALRRLCEGNPYTVEKLFS